MPYTKQTWTDRVVSKPMTYTMTNNADGTVTLTPAEGTVTQAGSPLSASRFNVLETQYDQAIDYVSKRSAVIARNNGVQNPASGVVSKVVVLTIEDLDKQGEYDTATSKFTAKEAGVYFFRVYLDWSSSPPADYSFVYLYKNGANYNGMIANAPALTRYVMGSCLVQLNAGDYLELYVLQSSAGASRTLSSCRIEIARIS